MSNFFHKPENALKRAIELLSIPNSDKGVLKRTKRSALEILRDSLIAKKHKIWQDIHEELMLLYLDICIDLQLGRVAKDGLHQYRNLCIQQNPASLENVINHFVNKTEQKLIEAKQQSNELIILAAAKVDLEAGQTPEAVMLSTTTFEGSNDRTDREVVVPWLRFAWEAYRTVLDILKFNTKLEALYKVIALKAFDFCIEYNRKIECRRVCEILRIHLSAQQKHAATSTSTSLRQMRSWDGFTVESVESLLEIRYRQLQVATELELYSEAFRTIDDINSIMSLIEQVPRLELMVTYYEKLAHIFLVSKNHLFHAYALYRWYVLKVGGLNGLEGGLSNKTQKILVSKEEQQSMATSVVLAALSIPLVEFEPVLEDETNASTTTTPTGPLVTREKNVRMAALLGFSSTPTRANLLSEVDTSGILKVSLPEVSVLYQKLEVEEVDPLDIVKRLSPQLTKLRNLAAIEDKKEESKLHHHLSLSSYIASVERLLVRRVLYQLTRVYSSVTISHLKSLFVGLDVTYEEIEQLIVRSRSLSTIANASAPSLSSMYLKNDKSSQYSRGGDVLGSGISSNGSLIRTKIRIDHVGQCIRFSDAAELEANPAQLTVLGDRIHAVLQKVGYKQHKVDTKKLFSTARANLDATRQSLLGRREIIERKKEELERLQNEKAKSIEMKRLEVEALRQRQEQERLAEAAKKRELEKKQKLQEEIALKETKQLLDRLGRTDINDEDLLKIDKEKILNEAKDAAQKAKDEAQRKLKENAKRLDYIIRATREVEQPILSDRFKQSKANALESYERECAEKLRAAEEAHTFGLKEKERLKPALTVVQPFVESHNARRMEKYKTEAAQQRKKKTLERLEKRIANAKARYDEEQQRIREEQEEQERRRREEEESRERERERLAEEEVRRQEEAEEEERRRLEEEKEAAAEAESATQRESQSVYRPPSARASRSDADGQWTSVNRSGRLMSEAPTGKWERSQAPPPRDTESGGLRKSFMNDRDNRSSQNRPYGGDRGDRGGQSNSRQRPGEGRSYYGNDRNDSRDSQDREGGSALDRVFRDREDRGGNRYNPKGSEYSSRRYDNNDRRQGDYESRDNSLGRGRPGDDSRENAFGRSRLGDDSRDSSYKRRQDDKDNGPRRSGAPESGRWRKM